MRKFEEIFKFVDAYNRNVEFIIIYISVMILVILTETGPACFKKLKKNQ